jgi:hypothetical protein
MKNKLITIVTGYMTSIYVELNGLEIGMSYDGKSTYQSTDTIELNNGYLKIVVQCNGFNGTDWSITITEENADKPIFKKSGTITNNNTSIIKETIKIE